MWRLTDNALASGVNAAPIYMKKPSKRSAKKQLRHKASAYQTETYQSPSRYMPTTATFDSTSGNAAKPRMPQHIFYGVNGREEPVFAAIPGSEHLFKDQVPEIAYCSSAVALSSNPGRQGTRNQDHNNAQQDNGKACETQATGELLASLDALGITYLVPQRQYVVLLHRAAVKTMTTPRSPSRFILGDRGPPCQNTES
jgi:hypothetical protein